MPFIYIKSLPFEESFDVPSVVETLSQDFARETQTDIKHVHAMWEFLQSGHYAVGGQSEVQQPKYSHPILVDVLTPDFNDSKTIEKMLKAIASSLTKQVNISRSNIFINYRQAHSGMVFDAGKIENW